MFNIQMEYTAHQQKWFKDEIEEKVTKNERNKDKWCHFKYTYTHTYTFSKYVLTKRSRWISLDT